MVWSDVQSVSDCQARAVALSVVWEAPATLAIPTRLTNETGHSRHIRLPTIPGAEVEGSAPLFLVPEVPDHQRRIDFRQPPRFRAP